MFSFMDRFVFVLYFGIAVLFLCAYLLYGLMIALILYRSVHFIYLIDPMFAALATAFCIPAYIFVLFYGAKLYRRATMWLIEL